MDDADLVTRVERCLRDTDPDLANMWRECVGMYGVRSAAAVGCLLGLVADIYVCPGAYVRESSAGGWVVCVRNLDPNGPVFAGPFRGETKLDALVLAVESFNP